MCMFFTTRAHFGGWKGIVICSSTLWITWKWCVGPFYGQFGWDCMSDLDLLSTLRWTQHFVWRCLGNLKIQLLNTEVDPCHLKSQHKKCLGTLQIFVAIWIIVDLTYGHKSATLGKGTHVYACAHGCLWFYLTLLCAYLHLNYWSLFKSVQRLRKQTQRLQTQLLHC